VTCTLRLIKWFCSDCLSPTLHQGIAHRQGHVLGCPTRCNRPPSHTDESSCYQCAHDLQGTVQLETQEWHEALNETSISEVFTVCTGSLGGESLKGHGIQIGGILEYLLQGVSLESVKTMGCWVSNTFQIYLHQHAMTLALHLQQKWYQTLIT
jgi:hypothetical protein